MESQLYNFFIITLDVKWKIFRKYILIINILNNSIGL